MRQMSVAFLRPSVGACPDRAARHSPGVLLCAAAVAHTFTVRSFGCNSYRFLMSRGAKSNNPAHYLAFGCFRRHFYQAPEKLQRPAGRIGRNPWPTIAHTSRLNFLPRAKAEPTIQ
jgi:hypothetical protein